MKFKLSLIPVLFLLVLPFSFAALIDDTLLILHNDDDCETNSVGADGTNTNAVNDQSNFQVGSGSCYFNVTSDIVFTSALLTDTMVNWTNSFWTNITTNNAEHVFLGLDDDLSSGDTECDLDLRTANRRIRCSGFGNSDDGVTTAMDTTNNWDMITIVQEVYLGVNITQRAYVNETEVWINSNPLVTYFPPDSPLWIGAYERSPSSNNFRGAMDEFVLWNRSLTPAEVEEHWIAGSAGNNIGVAPPSPALKEFTLTAKDTYNDSSLINFSFTISNSSFSFNDSTMNGTFLVNNVSVPSFDDLYTIEFRSNDSGGYFNRSFPNINITNAGSFEGDLFQSVLKLIALDGLNNNTILSFTAVTNQSSDSTTTGELLILIRSGTYQLNVTATGFDKLVTNFTIGTLSNNSLNVTMGSIFDFRLIREETNTPFNFNGTNTTELNIFCPNETIRINFSATNNVSQMINCQFTLMQIVVDYGALGSYFRTLIPPFSQKNITWYLIDLIAGDTAIQKVIQLVDLTGDFAEATLRVKRGIPGETTLKTIIEQQFDISNEVNLFLVKDAIYIINIENDEEDIALGNLIPTEAGTQTITLPKIDFVPDETTLGGDISWSYTLNITQGILRVQYVDTTNLTTLVRFTVRNGSSPTLNQLFQAESNNNATVTITFNQALANNTYITELFFEHPGLSNFTELRTFYEFFAGTQSALNLEGWTSEEQSVFKKWIAWIFLAVWGMFWSRRYIGIGMTTMIIWLWIFRTLKWVEVPAIVFGFVALLAVVGWIVEAMKKE